MSALAEALLAAQRQAISAATKAYVVGAIEDTGDLVTLLDSIGATDKIEQGHFLASLDVLRQLGAQAPQPSNGKPDPATEPASEAQMKYLRDLCDRSGKIAPDWPLNKEQASTVIEQLKAGTYNADEWTAPF